MKNQMETFPGSRHFRLKQVTDGVYAAIAVPGTGSLANAAIIDLGDSTVVVDTFMSIEAAKDLQTAARGLTGKPVSYVINTHWHSDHTSGNQVFSPQAQIISTTAAREIMATVGKNRVIQQLSNLETLNQAIAELEERSKQETNAKLKEEMLWELASEREYIRMLPDFAYTLPTITFEQQMSICGSDRSVQLITYGGGHTQSDAFVYLPEEKTAIMGDLVLSKHHPVLTHANPQAWLHILEQVELLAIETIVPGHGEICSMRELYEVKQYLNDIHALVAKAVRTHTGIEELSVPKAYEDWHFTTYFQSNLKRVEQLLAEAAGEQ
ncbi:MBL fold metallo-hydrolase [Brevibacillus fulvus]|uniref:Glyoxylase-like metal-dependent hydrolase (Beta-lactamase superfamily II) n=1 Tax=Brevibacillus fulvus TaxID=1125967 RepID=A0A939BU40_9BACL|nr:MBL fold metallo-hydrolase [Brevibacillus fulvus]MBM7589111.1 glyoxylase-like metal-dependent hydrolase (beta-lactamase superfamily II) [Brevibacillus fulvus]